jgi:hypothetical protein
MIDDVFEFATERLTTGEAAQAAALLLAWAGTDRRHVMMFLDQLDADERDGLAMWMTVKPAMTPGGESP